MREDEVNDVVGILLNRPKHSSLKRLDIICRISVDCATSIANLLKINKSIISLSCDADVICNDGIMAIAEAL